MINLILFILLLPFILLSTSILAVGALVLTLFVVSLIPFLVVAVLFGDKTTKVIDFQINEKKIL